MLNNWIEGHLWIKNEFGPEAAPHVGWSLDPFGLSTTQAVLQSLMGFDAWFFTRVPDARVARPARNAATALPVLLTGRRHAPWQYLATATIIASAVRCRAHSLNTPQVKHRPLDGWGGSQHVCEDGEQPVIISRGRRRGR